MQSLQQHQLLSKQDSPQFGFADCNHHGVSDFLDHCHLNQYLDIFLSEGFDSVTSLLEITEEDMIFMGVKRGHRRLIQREIATAKGIPRDQPSVTNMMGAKYSPDIMSASLKMDNSRISHNSNNSNNSNGYNVSSITNLNNGNVGPMSGCDTLPTGLTSPRSMTSGIGNSTSSSSGNSSSSETITTLRSRLQQQSPGDNSMGSSVNSSTNDSGNSSSGNINTKNNNTNANNTIQANRSDNRSSSISSNDDDDSIDTNESVLTKRKYRRHAKPDLHAPIKPPSAYIMFSNDARAELKNQSLSFAELAKIVGDQWKNLSHIEKQSYERMAMRAKDEYLAALERYRQTPQYNRYQEYLNDFKSKQDAANLLIGRARKRAMQKSPGSGSITDSSSSGNSNGNGSSGSGSADAYGDKESVIRHQRRPFDGYLALAPKQPSSNSLQSPEGYSDYDMEDIETNNVSEHSHQLRPIHHRHHNQHHNQQSQQQQQQQHHHQHQQQLQQQFSDSGYTSQSYYNSNPADKYTSSPSITNSQPHSNYRSNQIMRGMLPVEFIHTTPPVSKQQQQDTQPPLPTPPSLLTTTAKRRSLDVGDEENEAEEDERSLNFDSTKRRSPRFNKTNSSTMQI